MAQTTFRYLSHCCIDKTRRFYEELLGFEFDNARDSNHETTAKLLRMSPPFVVNLTFLKRDDFMIELQDFALHGTVAPREWVSNEPGLVFVSLDVKDLPGLIARVQEYGGEVLEDTRVGQAVCVKDPDGQVLELVAAREEIPDATRFRHIAHCVSDRARARKFYEELLGFTFKSARDSSREMTAKLLRMSLPMELELVFLDNNGMELELMEYPLHGTTPARDRPTNQPGIGFMHLDVQDLPGLFARLSEFGGTVIEETMVGSAAMIRDPDGQIVEMVATR